MATAEVVVVENQGLVHKYNVPARGERKEKNGHRQHKIDRGGEGSSEHVYHLHGLYNRMYVSGEKYGNRTLPGIVPFVTTTWKAEICLQVLAGVPQGSVLGPLLFLLYMNDITSADQSAHITLFADDTTILVSGSNRADVLSKSAEVMSNIQSWFRANKLSLNQAKTSYIYFNSPQSSSLPPIETPNLSLSSATEVGFLGLVVDSKLKWKTHIENLLPKLSTACFAVGSVRRNVDSNAALLSYFSYFHSVMSYGIVYWGFSSEIKNIFLLQKRAVRAVFGLARHISCKPIFKERQILTVYAQVILDTCILVHRVAPTLSRQSEVHDHDTRNKNKLLLSSNKIMDRSFLREGIQLYNSLSDQKGLRTEKGGDEEKQEEGDEKDDDEEKKKTKKEEEKRKEDKEEEKKKEEKKEKKKEKEEKKKKVNNNKKNEEKKKKKKKKKKKTKKKVRKFQTRSHSHEPWCRSKS
ncbi:hypothetical protein M8J77_000270 [Diaphorina citri]|nr:hypothetical protein M8J77_000270 [Diaphorina citri]